MQHLRWASLVALLAPVLAAGCGDDDDGGGRPPPGECSVAEQTGCGPGQVCLDLGNGEVGCFCSYRAQTGCPEGEVCEELVDGQYACFAPIFVRGQVVDSVDGLPIEGATVVARDANEVAVSSVATTDEEGEYELAVPVPRDADGNPADETLYTLRADAAGYLTFPKPPREAIPVDMTDAAGEPLVVDTAATDLVLIPLPEGDAAGTVSGTIEAETPGGALVVAGGQTAVADRDGNFTVFNVPPGSVEVGAYLGGTQLSSATVDVAAGQLTDDVTLESLGQATATVSGTVQIVNAPGGSITTVILVVEDTFIPNAARGEAPPGLRATNVSGTWSIAGVPDGDYVVLAAFENDDLVRDPDTSIGGTDIVHVTVNGSDVGPLEGFKVTAALAVISPGAEGAEPVSGIPTFVWEDDSSEDSYLLQVFDAFGDLVWEDEGAWDPGGNQPVERQYAGSALEVGMYYQFRATSIKDGVYISSTEDLRGVFWYEGQ
jgi:hypothetical protein